jgi:putative ABC transport system permease protein
VREVLLSLTWARRELRTGITGFWVFLACLALGVGAIAGVGAVSLSIQEALSRDARALAGGDVTVRTTYEPPGAAQMAFLNAQATRLSRSIEMRVMAGGQDADERRLAELKAIDNVYPLYGSLVLAPAMALADALALKDGVWGAVAAQGMLDAQGLTVGDKISVGSQAYELRAVLEREPDQSLGLANFGPRLMVAYDSVSGTGLLLPGSLVRYKYRLALPDGVEANSWADLAQARFPDAAWRITPSSRAAHGLSQMVGRLTLFLTLVGLTALLIGGIGVANAVQSYLAAKSSTIAMLKCVGAPAQVIFLTYSFQVLALAVLGVCLGLVVGAATPFVLGALLESLLPITLEPALYPRALATGAAFGLLTTGAFALWPLLKARRVAAVRLFHDLVAPSGGRPSLAEFLAIALLFALLAALAVATAIDKPFALWFVGGVTVAFALFFGAALSLSAVAKRLLRTRLARWRASLRLALANLCRPGAPTTSVVLSLGFGVTVLVAVAAIEANLGRTLNDDLSDSAPTFFFIDIQPSQLNAFTQIVEAIPGEHKLTYAPMLRARITKLNGQKPNLSQIQPDVRWVLQGERGLTYRALPPEGGKIVAGTWWSADYKGEPLISFAAHLGLGLGLKLGDTMTFNVLGREMTGTIASFRDVNFRSLRLAFSTIFSPGALERTPHTILATTHTPADQAGTLVRAVGAKFANITAIRVKEALEAVDALVQQIGNAIRVIAAVGLIAGVLVLASAVAAGQQARKRDAVVLKVLGATRGNVLATYLWEFGALGLGTVAIAAGIGALAAYVVVTQVLGMPWTTPWQAILLTAPIALAITLIAGFAGVWQALDQKPAPLLRNP